MTPLLLGLLLAAQPQPSSARPGWPCVGRPDPSMVAVSEASGGQIFLLDPSELGAAAAMLTARDGLDEVLRRVVGQVEPGMHTVEAHVDASVDRVLFSASLQCLQAIEIVRPSGVPVAASDPDVTWQAFDAGRQVGVRDPAPGPWTVRLAGKGLLAVVVHARAGVALERVQLVRADGRAGHEGLVRDDAPLIAGTRRLIEVRLSPGLVDPEFEMRTSGDGPLGPVWPERDARQDETATYRGEFTVPDQSFRVMVTGRDAAGSLVQRVQAGLFTVVQPR